ncbi:MAG: outer membrane beta-barrel protein [Acidobacteria bacterium]|nr:outer membrane beta-barrel protein [Acidobacteriota bacterium]
MMRLVRSAMIFVPLGALLAAPAAAQPPAVEAPFYVEGAVAATLGHASGSLFGAELGYRMNDTWELFVEGGHMGNITTADAERRAGLIGAALGGTANVVQKGNYGDIGVRYRLLAGRRWHPYATAGLGVISVDTETELSGSAVEVVLGADLSGHVTKTFLVLGAGVTTPVSGRWFADLSYRYGRIFPNSGAIDEDQGVNTQRVQAAIGLAF